MNRHRARRRRRQTGVSAQVRCRPGGWRRVCRHRRRPGARRARDHRRLRDLRRQATPDPAGKEPAHRREHRHHRGRSRRERQFATPSTGSTRARSNRFRQASHGGTTNTPAAPCTDLQSIATHVPPYAETELRTLPAGLRHIRSLSQSPRPSMCRSPIRHLRLSWFGRPSVRPSPDQHHRYKPLRYRQSVACGKKSALPPQ